MKIQDYDSAIKYLYSLELFGIKLGLQNISLLLEKLGNPHETLKYVHVGGTNGKGSVCAMVASVLASAGYRAGLYTSPHLADFRERIQINGEYIPEEKVLELTRALQELALEVESDLEVHPTYFEITTAMALKYFADENVDIAIMEVGMGGRFDATNVITPLISIINDISFDHMEYLGDTLDKIAFEKAGIIKPGVPVISSDQRPEAAEVIKKAAGEKRSPFYILNIDFHNDTKKCDRNGLIVDVSIEDPELVMSTGQKHFHDLTIPLIGEFQAKNCAIAVSVLGLLEQNGFRITEDSIHEGLSKVNWPARIQIVQNSPTVILDSSHNPVGIANLVDAIRKYFTYNDLKLVIGLVKEKDRKKIVQELGKLKPAVIAVKPASHRALEPEILLEEFRAVGVDGVVKQDIIDGIKYALANSEQDDLIVITGSFYTAGVAIGYWKHRN